VEIDSQEFFAIDLPNRLRNRNHSILKPCPCRNCRTGEWVSFPHLKWNDEHQVWICFDGLGHSHVEIVLFIGIDDTKEWWSKVPIGYGLGRKRGFVNAYRDWLSKQ